jgi:hypothetical protein
MSGRGARTGGTLRRPRTGERSGGTAVNPKANVQQRKMLRTHYAAKYRG